MQKRVKRIEKLQLYDIADLLKAGKTQKEISEILNISRSTLSDRIQTLRNEFPELLNDIDGLHEGDY